MPRANDDACARDGITWCAPCLCPDDRVVLRLTRIDLWEKNCLRDPKRETRQTYLRLIDIICNESLIPGLLNKRAPTWHQFDVFQAPIFALKFEIGVDRNVQYVKKPE